MHTKHTTPYLTKLPGRSGFYFQRKVPADLVKAVGKRLWRWKAGNTLLEARKESAHGLLKTDALIAMHRGTITPELLEWIDERPTAGIQEELQQHGLTPQTFYPHHSPEDAERLVQRQAGVGHRAEDLINQAIRLKQPAPSTQIEWRNHLGKAMAVAKRQNIDEVTEADARKYRDYLLDTVSGSTTKTRIRYVKALFNVARDEGWIDNNPFDCINMSYIKTKATPKQVKLLDEADSKVDVLPDYQQLIYWLMRYTGTHVGEAAGLRFEDIDLKSGVIHIRSNQLRPLKNEYRTRDLPIINTLKEKLTVLLRKQASGHIFPGLYDEKNARWGNKLRWERHLHITPKACRDAVATQLRDAEINERVLGSILGHTPRSSTGVYGSVSMEAKRNALDKLM